MPDFPRPYIASFPTITPWSWEAKQNDYRSRSPLNNTYNSRTWSVANKAFFFPFVLHELFNLVLMFMVNGATAADNWDAGIYLPNGIKVVSQGGRAQSGTTTLQTFDVTDTVLPPGRYFMALACDGTTGTVISSDSGFISVRRAVVAGLKEQTSAYALPDPATLAARTSTTSTPLFGLSSVTTL